jgi:hydroxymethylpyrimidine/phosphomethylpyrimidine kinase
MRGTKPPRILIIAGSDSGGGAGIQADIKTVTMLGGFPMTAITAITAQNTLGVEAVLAVPPEMVLRQIDVVVKDLGIDAIKIGMIALPKTAAVVAERIETLKGVPIVFDPVMVATSGAALADSDTIAAFERLMVAADVVTPNAPELTALTGIRIETVDQLEAAGRLLGERVRTAIFAKGGHLEGSQLTDVLIARDGTVARWQGSRIRNRGTHGTGCTLASGIATGLGRGQPLPKAIAMARDYVRDAIRAAPGFGGGDGPLGTRQERRRTG